MIGSDQSNPAGSTAFDPQQLFKTMQKAWQSLPMPAAMTPVMDIDELDKRIAELRAVEQWLEMNLNMLRTSVQGLEIQRGTLASLKAFGESLARPSAAADDAGKDSPGAPNPFEGFAQAMQGLGSQPGAAAHPWWQSLQEQFQQVANAALAGAATPPAPPPGADTGKPGREAASSDAPEAAAPPPDGVRQGTRGRRRPRPDKS